MSKNTAYMSRADAIVLLTAHLAPAMIADHGAGEGTPPRVVDFASKLADELVAQGVIDGPELDEDKGGPFTNFRATTDDDLDLDDDDDAAPEVTVTDTEPAPAQPVDAPASLAQTPPQGPPDPTYTHS